MIPLHGLHLHHRGGLCYLAFQLQGWMKPTKTAIICLTQYPACNNLTIYLGWQLVQLEYAYTQDKLVNLVSWI